MYAFRVSMKKRPDSTSLRSETQATDSTCKGWIAKTAARKPLRQTVAALWIENIGRPDPFIDYGAAWITGSDRTNLGQLLEEAGIDVEPDPRPELNVFQGTESVVLAQYSVPAHTLSSFSFHDDWHQPDDQIERIDFVHMAQVTMTAIQIVRYLATGEAPQWYPGARPPRTF